MNLCSGGRGKEAHEEIAYEGRDCPFCAYMEERADEVTDLRSQIEGLEKDIANMEEEA